MRGPGHGFRAPMDFQESESRKKVVLVGDSFTWGVGIDYDDTAKEFSMSFSLNGGTTFLSPFSPVPSLMTTAFPGVFLSALADPRQVVSVTPALSPAGLIAFGLLLLGAMYFAIRRQGAFAKT